MKKGYLYVVLATILFSSMEVALKMTADGFNAIQLTFLRFLIGGLILLPLAWRETRQKKNVFHKGDLAFFALTGFICVVVSMIVFQLGILYSPASIAAVLFSCNSVFMVMFAYLLLGERIRPHTVISIVITLFGMAVIINPFHMGGSFAGVVLSLAAAVTFAFYNVIGRTRSDRYGGITLTCFSFLIGCAEMLVLILASHVPQLAGGFRAAGLSVFADIPLFAGISLNSLPGLAYVGIFVTGLGYTFYFLALEKTSAATAALVFYIKPVLAPVFALLILSEPITRQLLFGTAFILLGSLVAFIPGIRPQKKKLKEDFREIESEFEAETDETAIKP